MENINLQPMVGFKIILFSESLQYSLQVPMYFFTGLGLGLG